MHIITPYNPWAPKKKKTWQEQQWEEQQIAEIEAKMLAEASSRTLPDNAPAIAAATVGGMANTMAGGGGQPTVQYFHPEADVVDFSASPLLDDGPVTVVFTNLTSTPQFDTYLWKFGDGTMSTDVNPTHVFDTGSFTVQLTASYASGPSNATSKTAYISSSLPTVTAAFTYVTQSGGAPNDITFTNASVNSSQTPTTTYLWLFGTGSLTSTAVNPAAVTYTAPGGYTASLQVTGSYGLMSLYTQSFVLA